VVFMAGGDEISSFRQRPKAKLLGESDKVGQRGTDRLGLPYWGRPELKTVECRSLISLRDRLPRCLAMQLEF
jgi:hypothetical protein